MANNRISTTELDFDAIKSSLKNYLQGQDAFKDYDFEGSAMATLLDVLAYNTHYSALYNNLAINESFLDSASKRSSVVSKAKMLGYIPRSATCPKATINLVVSSTTSSPATLVLPKYSPFNATIDGVVYRFYTTEDHLAVLNNNTYTFSNIDIKEGAVLTYKYTASSTQRYIIPNSDVDTSTLVVRVQENSTSSSFETFVNQESIITLTGTDPVYFLKEIEGELFEIEFGNGTIGKALEAGNVVNMEYMTTSKTAANGAKTFSYQGDPLLGGIVTVSTVTAATGGTDIENIDLIRYNAPRAYTAQNRCVTAEDYKSIIYELYPAAASVNVWGGEANDPPQYGAIYIAVEKADGELLTDEEKSFILTEILEPRKIVSMNPTFIDPIHLDIELNVSFYYNPLKTTRTAGDIAELVKNAILDYNDSELKKFSGIFKYSNLLGTIDDVEPSITSSIATIKVRRQVDPVFDQAVNYTVALGNPIYNSGVPENSIISTGFYLFNDTKVYYIDDLPTEGSDIGALRLFYYSSGQKVVIQNIGTVNYATGTFVVTGLNMASLAEDAFHFTIKPQSNDVVSIREQVARIDEAGLIVNAVIESGAENYTFTSSRN